MQAETEYVRAELVANEKEEDQKGRCVEEAIRPLVEKHRAPVPNEEKKQEQEGRHAGNRRRCC